MYRGVDYIELARMALATLAMGSAAFLWIMAWKLPDTRWHGVLLGIVLYAAGIYVLFGGAL